MSQVAEATKAQVKASMATGALPWKTLMLIIEFLMVPVTLAPTRTAPRNSQRDAARIACLMDKDREETEVAKELIIRTSVCVPLQSVDSLRDIVGTNVVGVKSGEQQTDDKDVIVLRKSRHGDPVDSRSVSDFLSSLK